MGFLCIPTLNLAAAAKPNIEKQSQDAKISVNQQLSRDFAQQVVTARSAENVAESEKADLGEEATETGEETVMQAECEARRILSARITHAGKIRFKALLSDC